MLMLLWRWIRSRSLSLVVVVPLVLLPLCALHLRRTLDSLVSSPPALPSCYFCLPFLLISPPLSPLPLPLALLGEGRKGGGPSSFVGVCCCCSRCLLVVVMADFLFGYSVVVVVVSGLPVTMLSLVLQV